MDPNVVIDSSVWIEYFRGGRGAMYDAVDTLLDEGQVLLCGVVEAEIIQGLRPRERRIVSDLFAALPYLEFDRQDYVAAGERLGDLRRRGMTIPLTDALLGVLCLRHGLSLLTLDRHFDHLPDVKLLPVEAT